MPSATIPPPAYVAARNTKKERRAFGAASLAVEARGFEPRSENRFTTASTCVAHQFDVSVSWPMDRRLPDEPTGSRSLAAGAPEDLSRFCDTCGAASGELPHRHSA